MKRYGRLDENLQGTLQKNRVFCAVMPIHDQRISRRTETRRLFELTKLKKAPSFVIVGLFSADHYLVPCLSLLSSECVVFTDVPRDFQRLAEYFSDGWRREGVIDSSCLFKIGAEVRTVRWKISNNTHPVPVLNNTHHSLPNAQWMRYVAFGRAFGSHPRGQGFESLQVHHQKSREIADFTAFLCFWSFPVSS